MIISYIIEINTHFCYFLLLNVLSACVSSAFGQRWVSIWSQILPLIFSNSTTRVCLPATTLSDEILILVVFQTINWVLTSRTNHCILSREAWDETSLRPCYTSRPDRPLRQPDLTAHPVGPCIPVTHQSSDGWRVTGGTDGPTWQPPV